MDNAIKESTNGGSISVVGGMFNQTEKEMDLPPKTAMEMKSLTYGEDSVIIPLVPNKELELDENSK